MKNKKLSAIAPVILATGMFFGENIDAQTYNKGFTPEQIKTIEQLQKDLPDTRPVNSNCALGYFVKEKAYNHYNFQNPVLVGKNVVLHRDWEPYMYGAKRKTTPEHIAQLIRNLDKTYDSYKELCGEPPYYGEKVLVCLPSNLGVVNGHAHTDRSIICLNTSSTQFHENFWPEVNHGSYVRTLMHEIAHIFLDKRDWYIGQQSIEAMTEFFISYALEKNRGANYGVPGEDGSRGYTTGTAHRTRILDDATKKYAEGTIPAFHSSPHESSAFGFYIQGMAGKFGWEPIKKAFRSYSDDNYTPQYKYTGSEQGCGALDFIERIAQATGNTKETLRSLPYSNEMASKFRVRITEQKKPPSSRAL